jgi:predicted DNA-binding antitoxin AbrB/MazE fold protein
MNSRVEAIYRNGVFQPLQSVQISENQHVVLSIQPTAALGLQQWVQRVRQLHEPIVRRQGVLPDSSGEIAADRVR